MSLKKWGIQNVKNNIVRFNSPRVSFNNNSDHISIEYKKILNEFYPKYIEILTSKDYKKYIKEIRIEGHTDSNYNKKLSTGEGLIYNIDLSQRRAKNVLEYITTLKVFKKYEHFIQTKTRVTGVGSAVPIINNHSENKILSRRVDFKVIINL